MNYISECERSDASYDERRQGKVGQFCSISFALLYVAIPPSNEMTTLDIRLFGIKNMSIEIISVTMSLFISTVGS